MLFKGTIHILVDVSDETEAFDCIAEAMRPLLREFSPHSGVIDWRYTADGAPIAADGRGFEYAPQRMATPCCSTSQPTAASEIGK